MGEVRAGWKIQHNRGGKKTQNKKVSISKKGMGLNTENLFKNKRKHQNKKGSLSKKGRGEERVNASGGDMGKSKDHANLSV